MNVWGLLIGGGLLVALWLLWEIGWDVYVTVRVSRETHSGDHPVG